MNKTIHTPRDQNFHFSDKIDFNQQNGAERQIVRRWRGDGSFFDESNQAAVIYKVPPLPSGIPGNHNRLTIAMDIGFSGSYLSYHHFVLAARLKTNHYISMRDGNPSGDNRSGAVALGSWVAQHGFPAVGRGAAIEEPEISDQFTNQFRNLRSNCVTENKIYRLALDSILYDGHMAHEVRLRDRSSGLMVYSTYQTEFSSFTRNYNTQSRLIMLATIASPGVFGGGFYSNLVSYWTLANEWISDP